MTSEVVKRGLANKKNKFKKTNTQEKKEKCSHS